MNIRVKTVLILVLMLILIGNLKITSASKISMAYLYGNYDYISLVERTDDALNVVSPSYFDLDENGNLKLNIIDKNLIKEMHEKEIKVTPFLSNHWDKAKGKKALSNAENLSEEIVKAINKYNLDGINIDIENVTEKEKTKYTNLVKILREKLGNDKIISVAVAANPYNWQTGWHGSYDYKELSKYADYLVIMAYDEHYESGTEGAVASIDFIEKSIEYALKNVEREKIVVGLPFYGRYWKEGDNYGGYGVSIERINNLIKKYESYVEYDDKNKTAIATITIKNSDTKPTINGKKLYAGTYKFYYENEESINEKIELVKQYNLKGIGCWSLGQETLSIWNNYSKYLKSSNKSETEENYSEVEWAKEAIEFVKEKGWIQGRTKNKYEPKEYLTRAEFATIITRILELDTNNIEETSYKDISSHWAKKEIITLTKTGLIEGYTDGTYRPDKYITREEIAKVLSNLIEKNEENTAVNFKDVDLKRWSYKYIEKMVQNGIMKGYENNTFRPNSNITRAEIAVVLERMYNN